MPHCRGITVELLSQYDFATIPEYPLATAHPTHSIHNTCPPANDEATPASDVYIPVYPYSQFWIRYCTAPPIPDTISYHFKMFIDGVHAVSWCSGKEQQWKGATQFALFEGPARVDGKKTVEKRVFAFSRLGDDGLEKPDTKRESMKGYDSSHYVEIRVHRASATKRIPRRLERYDQARNGDGIDLVNAGPAKADHPKRYFKVALIDSLDEPFVTFRYHYRLSEQLEEMGLYGMEIVSSVDDEPQSAGDSEGYRSEDDETPIGSPQGGFVPGPNDDIRLENLELDDMSSDSRPPLPPPHESPRQLRRLSIPPSLKLLPSLPSALANLHSITGKEKEELMAAPQRHLGIPVEKWPASTLSPIQSLRENLKTPPLRKGKETGKTGLMARIMPRATKKRTASSESENSESSANAASRSEQRPGQRERVSDWPQKQRGA